jgi:hypothetical protein
MEIQETKIDTQVNELKRLNTDNEDLVGLIDSEKDKNSKLVAIATDKYRMDLLKIDNYMPRGSAFAEKVKATEKRLIQEAQKQKK